MIPEIDIWGSHDELCKQLICFLGNINYILEKYSELRFKHNVQPEYKQLVSLKITLLLEGSYSYSKRQPFSKTPSPPTYHRSMILHSVSGKSSFGQMNSIMHVSWTRLLRWAFIRMSEFIGAEIIWTINELFQCWTNPRKICAHVENKSVHDNCFAAQALLATHFFHLSFFRWYW